MVNTFDNRKIREILDQVTDPEIPVLTIADLGLLRKVEVQNQTVIVTITPTYTGCPAMDMIQVNIKAALAEEGIQLIEIKQILDPPWTTDWISAEGRVKLEKYGIAPPQQQSTDKAALLGEAPVVPCPHCKSKTTEVISHFGSTPCKALYKCLVCLEPFDYFKCH